MTPTTDVPIHHTTSPRAKPPDDTLAFGTVFTDHMYLQEYDEEGGWHAARIEPYHPLTLDPAALVLHYAQTVFDGLKAFRGVDDRVRLFRPWQHAERLVASARRLCIPPLATSQIVQSFTTLVELEREWVPRTRGTALYLRPTMIATEPYLGLRPARSYLYFVILSPVGALYPEGMNPVKLVVSDRHVRAVEGGLGAAKAGGNYAASLLASREAYAAGYTQVLWLDGRQRRYLDEVGTMNIMLRIGDEVVTPPLSGSILPGITRDSVLTLLRDWGMTVHERPIAIEEVVAAAADGSLREMWGTGTAAVISPVGELTYRGQRMVINDGVTGEWTRRLYEMIVGIQNGTLPDRYGWTVEV